MESARIWRWGRKTGKQPCQQGVLGAKWRVGLELEKVIKCVQIEMTGRTDQWGSHGIKRSTKEIQKGIIRQIFASTDNSYVNFAQK